MIYNLVTWLIPEQCHILNDAVVCYRFSVSMHDRKKWLNNEQVPVEKETKSLEQANDAATLLHCNVVMASI